MKFTFGTREFIKCLEYLGCTPEEKKATSHLKYLLPKHLKPVNERDYITVILGKGSYDPNTCSRIINQLIKRGFDIDNILKGFKRKK